jgi:hypothetical protein
MRQITHTGREPLTMNNFFEAMKERYPHSFLLLQEWTKAYFGKYPVVVNKMSFAMQVGVLYEFFSEKVATPDFIVYDNWRKPDEVIDNLVIYFGELEEQITVK